MREKNILNIDCIFICTNGIWDSLETETFYICMETSIELNNLFHTIYLHLGI